jgi:hypothetical protein
MLNNKIKKVDNMDNTQSPNSLSYLKHKNVYCIADAPSIYLSKNKSYRVMAIGEVERNEILIINDRGFEQWYNCCLFQFIN